ncbi:unnamed protein product [Polarella glacialis]|uniref:Ppx/GppA phosphatase N-terminal domain-containing protein n=1 Tax=Polarella glacialis TaxID=89957 RepID=A0A813LGY4_POLGL|nr:unnamed protein product [Polarella glacialis]
MATMRRGAFDIGSGATKLMIADVHLGPPPHLGDVHFAQEIPVSFTMAWKQSSDGTLSPEIQEQGLSVLRQLLAECVRMGVQEHSAIATEVFRKASNGKAFLERIRDELNMEVEVVSQENEAQLGFLTAMALSGRPAAEMICWDSGGGSFQITSLAPVEVADGHGPSQLSELPLQSYLGCWGSGNTAHLLVEAVQGRCFAEQPSPNPVSAEEAEALVSRLRAELPAPSPSWLRGARVTAIGGPNSMFRLAAGLLQLLPAGGTSEVEAACYDANGIRKALQRVLCQSDKELEAMPEIGSGALRDPAGFCVPKLCLLLAVVESCGIAEVCFQSAIGSCPGLLVSSRASTSRQQNA